MFIITIAFTIFAGSFLLVSPAMAGDLEPADPPAPTMKTLEEIYNKPIWAIEGIDIDGNAFVFVDWGANPRFAVSKGYYTHDLAPDDDLVLDKTTGLIWTRDADIAAYLNNTYLDGGSTSSPEGPFNLLEACEYSKRLKLSNQMDWRLPTIEELSSLVDTSTTSGLPTGHPFINVQTDFPYWSSTSNLEDSVRFWHLSFDLKFASHFGALNKCYVLPVRGGNGRVVSAGW